MISNKVYKLDEWGDSIVYNVVCECGDPECNMSLELKIDNDFSEMVLEISSELDLPHYYLCDNWFKRIVKRINFAFKILTGKRVSYYDEIIIRGGEHINHLIEALNEGQEYINDRLNKGQQSLE